MKIYSIKYSYQYKTLSFVLTNIIFVVIFLCIEIYNENEKFKTVLMGGLAASTFVIFPSLILYIMYLYQSISKKIIIDNIVQKISFVSKLKTTTYQFKQIDKIVKVCAYARAEKRVEWSPTDSFYFYKLCMTDGKTIIITSFMTDESFCVDGYEIFIEKRFFPYCP